MKYSKLGRKVTDTFPVVSTYRGLIVEDFSRFSKSYTEILKKRLPTAKNVYFSNTSGQLTDYPSAQPELTDWSALFEVLKSERKSFAILGQSLMLLFPTMDGKPIAAVVEGADPLFLAKVGEDWLEETRAATEREFVLLKEARVDIQTGLFNLWNLYSLLDSNRQAAGLHLILIELPPKRQSFRYTVRYSQKCTTLLLNFIQGDSVLHSIGQSTFALVLSSRKEESKSELESALVAYLKREGCHKVHIGSSFSTVEDSTGEAGRQEKNLLDEAWTALHHAEKRGPFSFCDYNLLAHPENHPLVLPERNLVRRLSRLWRQSPAFSIVHFRNRSEVHTAKEVVLPLLDQGIPVTTKEDVFVYLDGFAAAAALAWSREVIRRTGDADPGNHLSVGVSCYPCGDFKKSEMPYNCRKALLHAAFFGDSSAVVFDSVSLNISGDIYFGDGDLAKAVHEYKRGLSLDKDNVNLHNSLGVALAMMDKLLPAMQSFENALAIDRQNFMALYNLGLAEQARGRKQLAFEYLEKALLHYNGEDAELGLLDDLKLQLGMLAGDLGNHLLALDCLEEWQRKNVKTHRAGRVHYYIGKARHGAGDNRRAMVELQRALQFNEFDDRAMDLLGIVYFREGEGDEIALALCQKAVELEPGNILYRCNLAEVQLQCGMLLASRKNLYRCLKNKRTRGRAQMLLGRSYIQEGVPRKAGNWFAKVLAQKDLPPEFYEEAKRRVREVAG